MDRKLLAVLGHPANEECAAVVLVRDEDGVVWEALTGERVSDKALASYAKQAREYLANLEQALGG